MLPPMIGRLEKTVLDCPDPRALAAFYAQVLGFEPGDPITKLAVGNLPD